MSDDSGRDLVLRAVQTLPDDERIVAMSWLMDVVSRPLVRVVSPPEPPAMHDVARGVGDLTMLPVRLPAAQYTALKEWCADNRFSMATVVRGLVEKFLSDQQRGRA